MASGRCSKCGTKVYPDVSLCDRCWNKEAVYDERTSGDPTYCSCGNRKYADASCCEQCWDRKSIYDDGRG